MQATPINSAVGTLIFVLGGAAGAVFYLPLKRVKGWGWESSWLVYAVSGLLLVPWLLAWATSPNLAAVLRSAPSGEIAYCLLCGVLWGFGGLTWGLMIRYLGFGLGLAMGAGLTSAAGTLIPPMLGGRIAIIRMFTTAAGIVSTGAAIVSLLGIVLVGLAGWSKERELREQEKKNVTTEFNFRKGTALAVFSGLMSSAMSFGLQGGPEIQKLALSIAPVTPVVWAGMPVLVVVLSGGFVVNGGWCILLNLRNKTVGNYFDPVSPLRANILFSGLAGIIWCSQFVCFKTAEPAMGSISYIGWAVLMASQILFSQILGLILGEWKGTSAKTARRLAAGLVILVASAALAAYSGSLGSS